MSISAHQALSDHFAAIKAAEAKLTEAKAHRQQIDAALNGPELTSERLKRLVSEGAETLAAWIAGGMTGKRPILDEERHRQLVTEDEQATLQAKAAAQLVSDADTQISDAQVRLSALRRQTETIASLALIEDARETALKYRTAMTYLTGAYTELFGLNRALASRGLADIGADAPQPNLIFPLFRVPGVFDHAEYAARKIIEINDGQIDRAASDWARQLAALTQGQAETNDQAA